VASAGLRRSRCPRAARATIHPGLLGAGTTCAATHNIRTGDPAERRVPACIAGDASIRTGARAAPPAASRPSPAAERARRAWAWADLMRRVFAIDVLACAGCGGRLRFIATIEDPPVVTKILAHLGLPTERPALIPARSPPQQDEFDFP